MIHFERSRVAVLGIALLGCLGLVAVTIADLAPWLLGSAIALVVLLTALGLRSEMRGELLCLRVDGNRLLVSSAAEPADMRIVEIRSFWDLSPWLIYLQLSGDSRKQPVFIWPDSCSEEGRRQLRRLLHNG